MILAHVTHNEHHLMVALLTAGVFLGMLITVALLQRYLDKRKGASK